MRLDGGGKNASDAAGIKNVFAWRVRFKCRPLIGWIFAGSLDLGIEKN